MNKLFYFALISVSILFSCNKTTDSGKLSDVSQEVELGQAGVFTLPASDGVTITADYYPNEGATQIIILCHQASYSRGEYKDIAPRLVDSGYACVAIDQRSGRMSNNVENLTAKSALSMNLPTEYMDAKVDILSVIDYISANSDKEIVLWGSSYSASLALIIAKENPKVKKVVAFSPGEYFGSQSTVKSIIAGLNTPSFITGGSEEYDLVVSQIVGVLPSASITAHKQTNPSDHGSKTLRLNAQSTSETYAKLFEFLD